MVNLDLKRFKDLPPPQRAELAFILLDWMAEVTQARQSDGFDKAIELAWDKVAAMEAEAKPRRVVPGVPLKDLNDGI